MPKVVIRIATMLTKRTGTMRRCKSRRTVYELRGLFDRLQDPHAQEEKDGEQERVGQVCVSTRNVERARY